MQSTSTYNHLMVLLKKYNKTARINTNRLREKMNCTPRTFGAALAAAVKNGEIFQVGSVPSDVPSHHGAEVGVYTRSLSF